MEFYLILIYKFYPRYVISQICFYVTCRLWISIIGPTYCKTCLALDSGTCNIFNASFPFCQTDIPNNNEYTYLLHVDVYRAKFNFIPVKVPIRHLKTRSQIKLVVFLANTLMYQIFFLKLHVCYFFPYLASEIYYEYIINILVYIHYRKSTVKNALFNSACRRKPKRNQLWVFRRWLASRFAHKFKFLFH